jgi:hypothetical protein
VWWARVLATWAGRLREQRTMVRSLLRLEEYADSTFTFREMIRK